MGVSLSVTAFDYKFWVDKLRELGYPIKPVELDLPTLKETKALPSDVEASKVLRLYFDDYVEVALVEFGSSVKLRRSVCTRTARSWKENRLIKPLLICTNGVDSFAVIVPGRGIGGEAKVLGLSDRLYRTDLDVLDSMRFPGKPEELSINYDKVFFPYEKVRNEFFEGYRTLYERVEKAVSKELKGESTSYAQRFLGRLMFLYFLQRKGWLKEDRRFIDTVKDYKELNGLFYESLNREETPGIPFLNGSLFEREPYMSATLEGHLYPKMDKLFKDARKFFNEYNFTVDETSPLEVEVSIDPALIGTVFENMLPEYERGSKGTFYTPRGESSFICRRALANYLGYADEVSVDGKTFIDGLSKYLEKLAKTKSEKEVREFREKLLSIKVLDPAVGSGGFLLVIMQELIGLIQDAEAIVGWKSDAELYKKRILRNLYGFDIEPEAIEIARLRLWLSLIIDQKEPEPLPNLDMNIAVIKDSLRQPVAHKFIDPKIEALREAFAEITAKYLDEHDAKVKKRLKEQRKEISDEVSKKTGTDPNVIEAHMLQKADVIVMNPPYVRQESLPQAKKDYYVSEYSLSKKSDLFAYFLARNLSLLVNDGVASVISSDKWLETGYGVSLQKKLKGHLVAIYGQRERTFGADINTVITVYSKEKTEKPICFTYIESYGGKDVRRHVEISRTDISFGKWFYLRAPQVFVEKILPKLNCKLSQFAVVKFGIKTGANEFFFLKNVSHSYETDFLADPTKFENWHTDARNEKDLNEKGLIYVENEGGHRFIIDRKDVAPVVRSPTEMNSYVATQTQSLLFKPNPPEKPGRYSKQYINWGETVSVIIGKGTEKGKRVRGFNRLSSTKSHRPFWFNVTNLDPAPLVSFKFIGERHFTPIYRGGVLADHTCDMIYPLRGFEEALWIYMNSSVYFLTRELYGMRMGGGALQMQSTAEMGEIPVPDISCLKTDPQIMAALKREPMPLFAELEQKDRKNMDLEVLKLLGFEKPEIVVEEVRTALVEVLADRLVKAHLSVDKTKAVNHKRRSRK
jgi:methylase of polypeptide subunit release factors